LVLIVSVVFFPRKSVFRRGEGREGKESQSLGTLSPDSRDASFASKK